MNGIWDPLISFSFQISFGLRHFLWLINELFFLGFFILKLTSFKSNKECFWKFNKRVRWTEDTLDCCRKILQPPNVAKFIFLYNSRYLIYSNNKNHKVQITDFEFISNVFIVSDGQDRLMKINFVFQLTFYLRKKQYTKFSFEILTANILLTFSNTNCNC